MNLVLLYLLLLKGTVTAFAGLVSLPVIQDLSVTQYHVLTNDQPNDAVVINSQLTWPSRALHCERRLLRLDFREPSQVGPR
jgi:chromate transporter